MSRDGELTLTRASHTLAGASDSVSIIPIGDVHWDVEACDRKAWRYFIDRIKRMDQKKVLYFGTGDLLDIGSISERMALKAAKLHDQTRDTIDEAVGKLCDGMAKELAFTRGRWIGMLGGNHDYEFQDGAKSKECGYTATERIAKALDAPMLGTLAYVALGLTCNGARCRVDIVANHGRAGGKLAGTTINQVADLKTVFPSADIYIMGHDHQRGAWPQSMLSVTHAGGAGSVLKLTARRQWLCRSGSFLRAYVPGQSSYAAAKLLRPADLGTIELRVSVRREPSRTVDGKRIHGGIVPDVVAIV